MVVCEIYLLYEEIAFQTEASGQEGSNERKRQRHGKDREVEDGRWKWFHFTQSRKVPINVPVLMQKAEEIAKQFGHDQLKSSDGRFNRWKKRHDLRYTELYGEASEADEEATAMWINENVQDLLKEYEPADVYNADETAFYFRTLPKSTYVKKSSRKLACGSKVAKNRLTVLVCCNMIGDKHGLLVIGTSQKPQCFKNVRAFPADYSYSKNAWITNGIWFDWMHTWDKSLCFQQPKIALLVDNCSAHGNVKNSNALKS